MTPFQCTHCQAVVFFENVACGTCGALLAFDPAAMRMQAYRATEGSADAAAPPWQPLPPASPAADAGAVPVVPCRNRSVHANCNWMVDDADEGQVLCRSCRLTRTIPDLAVAGNAERWGRIEQAKRRLVYGLRLRGLCPEPRRHADAPADAPAAAQAGVAADAGADRGLCFDLLADAPDGQPVRTGHDRGVITLNIAEADDAYREAQRVQLREPWRTLLGHLRHEVAHYLQYRWVDVSPALTERCRAVFGDERADYAEALQRHYAQGAPAGWETAHISAYASMHPWEDWAETCAHWLLIVDAVQTAGAWGLRIDGPARARPAGAGPGALVPAPALVIQHWLPVAQFLNAMNRSIGVPDSYPFLIPPAVLDKLAAVQALLGDAQAVAAGPRPSPTTPTPPQECMA